MRRPMGRPLVSTSERLGVYLPVELKQRLGIEALRRGTTVSELVVEAVRVFLAPKKRQPMLPGLDAPTGGQVQGEPEDVHERQPEGTGT